jgi:micrococcal nuclease
LQIVSLSSPIAKGANATLTAKTLPGASCTIAVYYKSKSSAAGLTPKAADGNGDVSWTWKVGASTTPGTWRIVVTAARDGKKVSVETPFVVQ